MSNGKTRKMMSVVRHKRLRKKVKGTPDRPRLAVFKSGKHIYAQVIDDTKAATLVSTGSLQKDLAGELKDKKRLEVAKLIGQTIGQKAKDAGVTQVVFDRGGFKYHGRVKALAEGARESGLEF